MKYIDRAVLVLTVIVAAWTFTPSLCSAISHEFNYGSTALGKIEHVINLHVNLDMILRLWVFFASVYACVRLAVVRRPRTGIRLALIGAIVVANYFVLYPLINFINAVFMLYLDNPPFIPHDAMAAEFPRAHEFERQFPAIKAEYMRYSGSPDCTFKQLPASRISRTDDGRCWRMLFLKRAGKFMPVAREFPVTRALVDHPQIHNALFSILDPNVSIPPHVGYYKGYLRYHIGIVIPKAKDKHSEPAYIICGGQKYHWKNGEGVLLDDMYYHHVRNDTDQVRVVLFLDVIRENMTPLMVMLNRLIVQLISNNVFVNMVIANQHRQVKSG